MTQFAIKKKSEVRTEAFMLCERQAMSLSGSETPFLPWAHPEVPQAWAAPQPGGLLGLQLIICRSGLPWGQGQNHIR